MAKKVKLTPEEEVTAYLEQLDHPMKAVVLALRGVILAAAESIGEQIKWNSLSFYYTGDMKPFDPKEYKRDIVVLNLNKKDAVLLVFPTGAAISDTTGLLTGNYPDGRRMASFSTAADVTNRQKDLHTILLLWLQQVDK